MEVGYCQIEIFKNQGSVLSGGEEKAELCSLGQFGKARNFGLLQDIMWALTTKQRQKWGHINDKLHLLLSFIQCILVLLKITTRHASLVCILFIADTWTSNQNIKLRFMCYVTLSNKSVHESWKQRFRLRRSYNSPCSGYGFS